MTDIWASLRSTATEMITEYGCRAILRRNEGDRDCLASMIDFLPRGQPGSLRNTPDRVFLVAAEGLTVPPDAEKDCLVTIDPITGAEVETLRLISPIGKIAPAGVVLCWKLQARR
jgi:hypothetical protein